MAAFQDNLDFIREQNDQPFISSSSDFDGRSLSNDRLDPSDQPKAFNAPVPRHVPALTSPSAPSTGSAPSANLHAAPSHTLTRPTINLPTAPSHTLARPTVNPTTAPSHIQARPTADRPKRSSPCPTTNNLIRKIISAASFRRLSPLERQLPTETSTKHPSG